MPMATTVLFPGTVLPLHVTDSDIVLLLEDAIASEAIVGVVRLDPTSGPTESLAKVCAVGCVGRIIHAEKLANDSYNVLIQGVQRMNIIKEIPSERYRRFHVELMPLPTEKDLEEASLELGRLESCIMSLRTSLEDKDAQLGEVLRSTPDPVQIADVLAAAVISDSDLQQKLLAAQKVRNRIQMLIDGLAEVMVRVGEPPKTAQMN